MMFFDEAREQKLNVKNLGAGEYVTYWMSRDQRIQGNWAFVRALILAKTHKKKVNVVFCHNSKFPSAQANHFSFMKNGIKEVATNLKALGIELIELHGEPKIEIPRFALTNTSILVTDFSPLRNGRAIREVIAKELECKMLEVDAHNIIPAFFVSKKEEYAAYTLRPKIHNNLDRFLTEYPKIGDTNQAATKVLKEFLENKLYRYSDDRNNPNKNGQSNLSSFLHFGNISSQEIVMAAIEAVKKDPTLKSSYDSFFEELVIRKELSDNFCLYNKKYDSFEGFRNWAIKSLNAHRGDKRDFTYTLEQFENASTHEDLWNAAQTEMVKNGKMHGYMRMYWAKKILEWSSTPEEAMKTAIYLNNKYEIDGRDPNGYAGIAWSIGGAHDRPWFERPVFGQVRYMNRAGCQKKFDTKAYIKANL